MHSRSIQPSVLLLVLFAFHHLFGVFAEELEAKEVPSACSAICAPMVTLTSTCKVDIDGGDNETDAQEDANDATERQLERECICTNKSFDVATISALCASCIQQNGGTDPTDDMDEIMSSCSFSSTSFAPSATALAAGITVSAVKPTATSAATSASTTASSSSTSSGSGQSSSSNSSNNGGVFENSANAEANLGSFSRTLQLSSGFMLAVFAFMAMR